MSNNDGNDSGSEGSASEKSSSWETLPDGVKKDNASIAANDGSESSDGSVEEVSPDGDDG